MTAFRDTLMSRFGGMLYSGSHSPDSIACALEVASIARGHEWSDDPLTAGLPDLRPLNDAPWSSDAARTVALLPVIEAYWEWPAWSRTRRAVVLTRLAELLIRRVVPVPLRTVGLTAEADRCEQESTYTAGYAANAAAIHAAYAAAYAAYAAAIHAAGYAAYAASAASAAAYAAYAAANAAKATHAHASDAADTLLKIACQCWIEAAWII